VLRVAATEDENLAVRPMALYAVAIIERRIDANATI
jgi:hypothetical protein